MPTTSYVKVTDVIYTDPRTGQRIRERKVQDVAYDPTEEARGREVVLSADVAANRFKQEDRRAGTLITRHRNSSPASSTSSDESAGRYENRRHSRRARSAQQSRRDRQSEKGDDEKLWFSQKPRREGNWCERNFDSSYDGLIAAAAGAAIGGITARCLVSTERRRWQIGGGAIAGALVFNLAENQWKQYITEKEEEIEEGREKGR